jgi:diketogulonate reductase-like aldo/keto reductase
VYPIAASATPDEFADNAAALELELSFEEIARLQEAGPG